MVSDALRSVQSKLEYIHHTNLECTCHTHLAVVNNDKYVQLINCHGSLAGRCHAVVCEMDFVAWYSTLSNRFRTGQNTMWRRKLRISTIYKADITRRHGNCAFSGSPKAQNGVNAISNGIDSIRHCPIV